MKTRSTLLLLSLAALACAPAATSTDTAADDQAIRAAMETLNQGITGQNDSLTASIYAEDAVMMPPGATKVTGRANIRAFWATVWPLRATLTITPAAITVSGDWAYGEGTWTWTAPVTGGEQRDHGKYLDVWHRIDGNWSMVRDIWNSDLAPAEAEKVVKP
jgi:uncharacterized protein (TIGR02246 family)